MGVPDYIPRDYKRIQVVDNLPALFGYAFKTKQCKAEDVNCVVFPRQLGGDFNMLARRLSPKLGGHEDFPLTSLKILLRDQSLRSGVRIATLAVIQDMQDLATMFPSKDVDDVKLRVIAATGYYASSLSEHKFHADGAQTKSGRILCCYNEPVTEWVPNEDVERVQGGQYYPKQNARISRFPLHSLFRMATSGFKDQIDPPGVFVHRAPAAGTPGPRLLLVGG